MEEIEEEEEGDQEWMDLEWYIFVSIYVFQNVFISLK